MRLRNSISILIFSVAIAACSTSIGNTDKKAVARVHSTYLYTNDLFDLIPDDMESQDSLKIANRLIEEWVRNQLLLHQAELHLPEDQRDIENQVEEYRSSLLTFRYKQLLLQDNLDENIEPKEIEKYYSENSSNYILESDLVQVTYLKIPVSAPQISQVRLWYKSSREKYITNLKEYALQYAEDYAIMDTSWIYFRDLINKTALNIDNSERYLNYNKNIETKDSVFYYFIHINNRLKEGDIKPLMLVKDNIRSVLLNKRKIEFIQDLENTVYKEGISRNQVEIY